MKLRFCLHTLYKKKKKHCFCDIWSFSFKLRNHLIVISLLKGFVSPFYQTSGFDSHFTIGDKRWPFHLTGLLCPSPPSTLSQLLSAHFCAVIYFPLCAQTSLLFYNSVGFTFTLCLFYLLKGQWTPSLVVVLLCFTAEVNKSKWPELLNCSSVSYGCAAPPCCWTSSSSLFEAFGLCGSKRSPITLRLPARRSTTTLFCDSSTEFLFDSRIRKTLYFTMMQCRAAKSEPPTSKPMLSSARSPSESQEAAWFQMIR